MNKSGIKKYIFLLMIAHLCVDMNQGALPAALPFLIAIKGLNYTAATGLVFASNISSSLVQPLFGYLGDKSARYWFISLGIILGGSGFAMIGLFDNYWAIFFAAIVSGVGIAIFHPEGGRLSNQVSEKNKSGNMSIFATGGTLAFAAGPLLLSFSMTNFGIRGTAVFLIPGFVMVAIYMAVIKNLRKAVGENIANEGRSGGVRSEGVPEASAPQVYRPAGKDDRPAFIKLSVFVFFRSAILFGMTTFIPLYWVDMLKQTQAAGSIALAIYSIATAFATLIGGFLADRLGYNKIINISTITFIPLLALFTFIPDLRLSTVLLVLLGFSLQFCFSTVITTGQSFLPNHIGFASGVTMGMGSSVGAVTAPLLGRIGDIYGLTTTFYVLIAIACITAVTGFFVPKQKH